MSSARQPAVPWDQRIARRLVQPLVATAVTPNHLTALSLIVAVLGAGLFALGKPGFANWGAVLFVSGRFLDHFDGELARLSGRSSRFGYYFDYVAGALSYAALFVGIGVGIARAGGSVWPYGLAAVGTLAALSGMLLNLDVDRHSDGGEGDAVGYPAYAGFELEDGIYLIAPLTWLGLIKPFFVLAAVGSCLYVVWTLARLLRMRRAARA